MARIILSIIVPDSPKNKQEEVFRASWFRFKVWVMLMLSDVHHSLRPFPLHLVAFSFHRDTNFSTSAVLKNFFFFFAFFQLFCQFSTQVFLMCKFYDHKNRWMEMNSQSGHWGFHWCAWPLIWFSSDFMATCLQKFALLLEDTDHQWQPVV